MLNLKTGLLAVMVVFGAGGAGAQACGAKNDGAARKSADGPKSKQTPAPTATPAAAEWEEAEAVDQRPIEKRVQEGLGVLAEGMYGGTEEPFVVVARDAEVYAGLRRLVEGLPDVGPDYFKRKSVVAAFLGTRNTGGYGVNFKLGAGVRLAVAEQSPPADAITTQALTQPYKVVSVPVADDEGVELNLQGRWAEDAARAYRVASGEFTAGGGLAGRREAFALEGGLRVWRLGNLATVLFDLKGAGASQSRALRGAATGLVREDGTLSIATTDAGTFVSRPRSPLRVTGRLAGDKLTLAFESLPPRAADGFGGAGRLEATATAPARPPVRRRPPEM